MRRGGTALLVLVAGGALAAPGCATTDGAAAGAPPPASSVVAAAVSAAPAPTGVTPAAPGPAPNPWIEPAREVLVQHCGRCHRGDLPTAVPDALRVFDLTRPVWSEHLARPQYDGILTRVHESRAIEPDEVAAVEAFVRCARDGACGAS